MAPSGPSLRTLAILATACALWTSAGCTSQSPSSPAAQVCAADADCPGDVKCIASRCASAAQGAISEESDNRNGIRHFFKQLLRRLF